MTGEDGQLAGATFALTGFDAARTNRLAIKIPETHAGFDPADVVKAYDIDSVKGAIIEGDKWPFTGALQLYTVPPPKETMHRSSKYWLNLNDKNAS